MLLEYYIKKKGYSGWCFGPHLILQIKEVCNEEINTLVLYYRILIKTKSSRHIFIQHFDITFPLQNKVYNAEMLSNRAVK